VAEEGWMWEWTVVAAKEATAVDEQEVTEMVAKTGATDNVEAEEGVPEATVGEGERMAAEEREEELVVAVRLAVKGEVVAAWGVRVVVAVVEMGRPSLHHTHNTHQ